MSNLEQKMKAVAEALTGKKADEIPNNLEDICSFIAGNYSGSGASRAKPVTAPAEITAAPTKEDFNGLIAKLKEAEVFQ